MWRAAKVCFLYIGTVIGAGFASGREIALFFGDTAPLNVALTAVFMAVPEALFLVAGKLGALPSGTVVKTGVFVAAFSSVAAMLAGCELALVELTGFAGLGVIAAIAAGMLVIGGTEKMKLANTVLIPLLLILLLVVYVKSGSPVYGGSFSLVKPAHYAGLDVLMGGMIISREGKKLNGKEIAITCAFSAAFLGIVLFVLQNIVLSDETYASMPVLAVAEGVGLKVAAGVLIVIAVFTTLVSSLDVLTDSLTDGLRGAVCAPVRAHGHAHKNTLSPGGKTRRTVGEINAPPPGGQPPEKTAKEKRGVLRRAAAYISAPEHRSLAVFLCLLLLYPVSFFGFENIVNSLYPFVGLCGVAMTVLTALKLARVLIERRKTQPRGTQTLTNFTSS